MGGYLSQVMDENNPDEAMRIANEAIAAKSLTPEQARKAMQAMFSGNAPTERVKEFLKGLTLELCTAPIVSALADEMRKSASPFPYPGNGLDIVGTGGDGQNTYNISTAASFLIAATGIEVTKHGNNAASSRSGSADLLKSLGVELALDAAQTGKVLQDAGMCFLYARKFHPAMKHVAPIRRELKIRTVFNILGPLTNPAKPRFQLSGVFDKSIGRMYIESLKAVGLERAMVVCGQEGLDEISIAGPTDYWLLEDGEITEGTITPEDFGLQRYPLDECRSGTPEENAEKLNKIFAGEQGPVTDFVCMNAAAAVKLAGKAKDYKSAMELVRKAISDGSAAKTLKNFTEATQRAAQKVES